MNPHILHVSNAFAQSALYKQLVSHLDTLEIKQTVYSAVRTQKEANFDPPELRHLDIHIPNLLHPYDRLFFRNKIRKISKDIFNEVDLSTIDLIHAHTLYSDGATALKIKKKTGIPYITTVRNTDLSAFQKYRPDLRWRRNKILSEAYRIVFITPAYCSKFLSLLNKPAQALIESKTVTIPNGIDPLFLDSPPFSEDQNSSTLKLLYVGDFIERKNVPKLLQAARLLSNKGSVELTLVGGGGGSDAKVKQMIASGNYPFVSYLGYIKDMKKLREIYRLNDIFIMASRKETFGLVYLEALSQGLPIVYTKGEGVDGYFKEEGRISEVVIDSYSIKEIANKIEILSKRLGKSLCKECVKQAKKFDWDKIAEKYDNIYRSILSKNCINTGS